MKASAPALVFVALATTLAALPAVADTICPGVQATLDGNSDVSAALQQCISQTPNGGILEIPSGWYLIGNQVTISRRITLRTRGKAGSNQTCNILANDCAWLFPTNNFYAQGGFLRVANTRNVTIDHIILTGAKNSRKYSSAANKCRQGQNSYGFNMQVINCLNCRFRYSVSRSALCGTGLEWTGDNATITRNNISDNGYEWPADTNLWADGLTVLDSDGARITHNTIANNTDVGLILGGARNAYVARNTILQQYTQAFAGFMLHSFNNTTSGDFRGALVTQNTIECGYLCHFGMNLGPKAWEPYSRSTLGGTVTGNTIRKASMGINVDGAGTLSAKLVLYSNPVLDHPGLGRFTCGLRGTSPLNIHASDSHVDRQGDSSPATNWAWHSCP